MVDGKAIGDAIAGLMVLCIVVGGVVGIGLWELGCWLYRHVHLGWS